MTRVSVLLRPGLVVACALAVSGCISLLPKSKPAHLYRFGDTAQAQASAPAAGSVGVVRNAGAFQRESAGDRLLTITGGKAAYVAETRWVAPAAVLWDQALAAAFDADPGPVRLVSRGEPAAADYVLRVDVRNFETRYEAGPKAAPTVLVRARAVMIRAERREVSEQIFEARVPASGNRVAAIVRAYDKATADVLGQIVAWTNGQVQAGA
ncbi:ABC-type transport auxiliary lipoprotein family protein [Phenylobacterium sp.]|uniref:ABC-type transport auxiliary lipoprotein family protein n=1 Tax=Phenylobacterium sp. TaxID=1871053 RepID=UPI00393F4988